ncbi:MAG: Ig-like domain-containing protein [Acidimicrobiales bacterium]
MTTQVHCATKSRRHPAASRLLIALALSASVVVVAGSSVPAWAAGSPATISVVPSTNPQSSPLTPGGCGVFTNLKVIVLDAQGNPVSGVTVTFTTPSSAPTADWNCNTGPHTGSDTATTNATGVAEAPPLNPCSGCGGSSAGSYQVTATVAGVATPAVFELTNTSSTPDTLTASLPSTPQSAQVGTTFRTPLQAVLTNASGQPVSGVPVTFTAFTATDSGQGSFGAASGSFTGKVSQVTQSTDPEGIATAPQFTANFAEGSFLVAASASGAYVPAVFEMTNLRDQPGKIAVVPSTNPQSSPLTPGGCGVFTNLKAIVLDAQGSPVSGVTVTFTTPGSAPTADWNCNTGPNTGSDTATTNATGVAEAPPLNPCSGCGGNSAGSYQVTATAPGVATPAVFDLTNTSGTPDTLTASLASMSQSAAPGHPFATPLQATLTNSSKQPVGDVAVTFTAFDSTESGQGKFGPASSTFSGGVIQVTENTDPQGVATASTLTANGSVGSYVVTASAADAQVPAVFNLTNAPPKPGCSSTGVGSASFPGGYWLAGANGAVYSCGDAPFYGSLVTLGIKASHRIVGITATMDHKGYWLVASDGGVFSFGDAVFYGSMGGKKLNKPIVGIAASSSGGYYEVASDGGIFAFGPGTNFYGSMGGKHLNKPVVGITITRSGGYYEVASDGGIFAFGPGAMFHGSMGGRPLNKPVVGIAVTQSGGYYEVASDGGVFSFGAAFHGSTGCIVLNEPIVGLAVSRNSTSVGTGTACATFTGHQAPGGYRFVAADGGVFSFGNAVFAGSLGSEGVSDIVGIATS